MAEKRQTRPQQQPANRTRDLNDEMRHNGAASGRWLMTPGVLDLGREFCALAAKSVRQFSAFSLENDPNGEHDFGSFELEGEQLFWKIDYYDTTMSVASDDPSDPSITSRVLTIMLASEY